MVATSNCRIPYQPVLSTQYLWNGAVLEAGHAKTYRKIDKKQQHVLYFYLKNDAFN